MRKFVQHGPRQVHTHDLFSLFNPNGHTQRIHNDSTEHGKEPLVTSTLGSSYKSRRTPVLSTSDDTVRSVRIENNVNVQENFQQRLLKMKKRMEDMKKKDVFTITTAAASKLRQLLQRAPPQKNCIKIGVRRQGCSGYSYTMDYAFDIPKKDTQDGSCVENGDFRITKDGIVVLVDENAVFFLSGTQLDFKSTDVEERFVFQNPNAKHYCGCGESFLV